MAERDEEKRNVDAVLARMQDMKRAQWQALKPFLRWTSLTAGVVSAAAAVTGQWWLFPPAVGLTIVAGFYAVLPFLNGRPMLPSDDGKSPQIGLGSTVGSGAQVEIGARIEMGATVESGAVIKRGAVVGMGATVEEGAVVEQDAVIGWGAMVRSGAVIKRGATVGAGSTIESHAVVEENVRIGPGTTVSTRRGGRPVEDRLPERPALPDVDPRDVRIDELCDRCEIELGQLTGKVDEFLRNPKETATSVRSTCHDLLRRERDLRREANPAEQERLNREAAALEARISAESDDITRQQLQGAVVALEEQRHQRLLLLRDANRLEAEQTRLVWTMEGLVAHMVRLRTTQASNARTDLDQRLSTLRDEVASIASAMEQVQSPEAPQAPREGAMEFSEPAAVRRPVRS